VLELLVGYKDKDKRKLFRISSAIIMAAYIIDMLWMDDTLTMTYNTVALIVTAVMFIAAYSSKVAIERPIIATIYTLSCCVILTFFSRCDTYELGKLYHSVAIIGVSIPFAGLMIGKRHTIYSSVILFLFFISGSYAINSFAFSIETILSVILITGYALTTYYMVHLFEVSSKERIAYLKGQDEYESNSQFMHSLSLELAACPSENVMPIMAAKIKAYTNSPFVAVTRFDRDMNMFDIQHVNADPDILDKIARISKRELNNTKIFVDEHILNGLTKQMVTITKSPVEITKGFTSRSNSLEIKRVCGFETFLVLVHKMVDQIFGATIVALGKAHSVPNRDLLNSYAYISALTLKRHNTEKTLADSEARLRQITNHIADVVYVSDLNLKVRYVSPSIERLTGNTPDQHLRRTLSERYTQPSLIKLKNAIVKELEEEKNPEADKNRTTILDVQMFNNIGEPIDVSIHLSLFRNKNYEPIGIQGIIRDITRRKTAERELIKSQMELKRLVADKDRFMTVISHDLRMPFQSLIGFSELMLNSFDIFSESEKKEMLKQIFQTSMQTYFMFDNLLLWAKEQSGRLVINTKEIDIESLVRSVADEASFTASLKNITITINTASNKTICADENILRTTFRNLISNAVKFSHPGSQIVINSEWRKDKLIVSVADSGIGIEENDLEKIWNAHESSSRGGTSGERGSGTGLSLCRQLIERHQGRIWVESQPGEGSTFYVEIPKTIQQNCPPQQEVNGGQK
jgi:PAS domain S-box-containing protein